MGAGAPTAGERLEVETPRGLAEARVLVPGGPAAGLVVLGHGAGGGVDAPDLAAVTRALLVADVAVALVTQPYRVAGRRAPAPAAALDEAWLAAVEAVRHHLPPGLPLVSGGRSSGARVACRTAAAVGAAGVVALAFPLQPPGRAAAEPPRSAVAGRPSRAPELRAAAAAAPVLVVQGSADAFGGPEAVLVAGGGSPRVTVHPVAGADHALRAGRPRGVPADVAEAVVRHVTQWVTRLR